MSITVEFRRHSIRDAVDLGSVSELGMRLARSIGEKRLRGKKFTHFFTSPIWLTQQTLVAFAEGAGDFRLIATPPPAPIYAQQNKKLRSLLVACRMAELKGKELLPAAFAYDRGTVVSTALLMAQMFSDWMMSLPDGSHVLIVGHSPEMEFIPFGLIDVVIPSLKSCESFRLQWRDGKLPRLDILGTQNLL